MKSDVKKYLERKDKSKVKIIIIYSLILLRKEMRNQDKSDIEKMFKVRGVSLIIKYGVSESKSILKYIVQRDVDGVIIVKFKGQLVYLYVGFFQCWDLFKDGFCN